MPRIAALPAVMASKSHVRRLHGKLCGTGRGTRMKLMIPSGRLKLFTVSFQVRKPTKKRKNNHNENNEKIEASNFSAHAPRSS